MKTSPLLARIFDRIVDVMACIAGVLAIAVMVLICYLVVMRYIFSKPPAWIIEVCEYMLIYITFLSPTWLLRNNGHVRVDLFVSWLPPRHQKTIRRVTSFIGGVACAVLTYCGLVVTIDNYTRNILSIQTMSIPKWMLYAVIPVGTLFLSIEFFRQTFSSSVAHAEDRQTSPTMESGSEAGG